MCFVQYCNMYNSFLFFVRLWAPGTEHYSTKYILTYINKYIYIYICIPYFLIETLILNKCLTPFKRLTAWLK